MVETKTKSYEERERERLTSQARLERCRAIIKNDFPNLKIEETIEYINKKKNNPQCTTCSCYYSQSSRTDIKNKIKGINVKSEQSLLLRIYKNSAEKLEDSKGYCCYLISPINHVKTMIPVPDLSLCSEWTLHHIIRDYFTIIHQTITKEKDKENKELEKKLKALKQKEEALKLIGRIDKKYNNTDKK